MAQSAVTDFTPIPQILRAKMRQRFVARSLRMGSLFGPSGAFVLAGLEGFAQGGRYIDQPILKNSLTINRRDIESTATITPEKLTGANNKGVVVHRRSGLVDFSDDTMWAGWSREELSGALGEMLADKMLDDLISTAIAASRGAIGAVGSSAHIHSVWVASGERILLSPSVIRGARLKMGDHGDQLTMMLARAESYDDLRGDAEGRSYDAVGGQALAGRDGTNQYGLAHAVRNDASLTTSDAGFDKYHTLLLGPGFMRIGMPQAVEIETVRELGQETKRTQWRADWSPSIHVPTMEYDSTDGGANPTVAALRTTANWIDNTTDANEVPGVEIVHNAAGL